MNQTLNIGTVGEVTPNTRSLLGNAAPGPGGTYKGSNSLVKSALQKNVRLCQPDKAVRSAAADHAPMPAG